MPKKPTKLNLVIPHEILANKDLSDRQKIVLAAIVQIYKHNKVCFASNGYLSEWLGIPEKEVSVTVSTLNNKGFIERKLFYKGKQIDRREITPLKVSPKRGGVSRNSGEGIPQNGKEI